MLYEVITSESQRERIIRAVATMMDFTMDPREPTVDGLIPFYDARFSGIMYPVTRAATFTIRKPPARIFTLEEYLKDGRVTKENYETIVEAIKNRENILIGGSTGAGKTTLINSVIDKMCEFTPDDRFYIVEDVPEIKCRAKDHLLVLSLPDTAAEKVRLALRQTPDRIIFGELRYGSVANELLKSWNTGHEGNVTTIHASSCRTMFRRLQGMLKEVDSDEANNLSDVIHLLVHITKRPGFGPYIDEVQRTQVYVVRNNFV